MTKIYQDLLLKMDWSLLSIRKKLGCQQKNIKIKTPMLISNLCDFSDAYIVVKGDIAVAKNTDCQWFWGAP